MAIDEKLMSFVRDALGQGISRSEIEKALLNAGWEPSHVESALNSFAEVEFPLPVPKPKPYLSARDAFMYLILFTTLYITAINFGSLIFTFINLAFPDPATKISDLAWQASIRFAVSSLIISFPIFLYVSHLLKRDIKQEPNKRGSKVRKWLTYITLFITASVIICDLISLVYNLLGGELHIRFYLKVLTVAVIAGSIFLYYLWDLRE